MKKIYTLLAGLSLAVALKAQGPTITSANLPQTGTSARAQAADTTGFKVGGAGASQTWTYSLKDEGSVINTQFLPAAAGTVASFFPGATVVNSTAGTELYYKVTTSAAELLGAYTNGILNLNASPEEILPLPLSYGASFSNALFSGTDSSSGIKTNVKGSSSGNADAWGSLTVDGVNFPSVVRFKQTSTFIDTAKKAGLILNTITYYWYSSAHPTPLLKYTITNSTLFPGGTTAPPSYALQYDKDAIAGINNISAPVSVRSIVPNPCTNQTTINLDMNDAAQTQLIVYDVMGRMVWSHDYAQLDKGVHTFTINTGDMPAGVYMIMANANNSRYTLGKFIKQ